MSDLSEGSPPLLQEPLGDENANEESSAQGSSDQSGDGVILPTNRITSPGGEMENQPCIACSREYPGPTLFESYVGEMLYWFQQQQGQPLATEW